MISHYTITNTWFMHMLSSELKATWQWEELVCHCCLNHMFLYKAVELSSCTFYCCANLIN